MLDRQWYALDMNTLLITLFVSMSSAYKLPPKLLEAICYTESKFDVTAVHHDDGRGDSLGVCQIKYDTAKLMGFKGTPEQLMYPPNNIKYAAAYLRHQITRYQGNTTQAIIAYNRGNITSKVDGKHLTKTEYSDKVLKRWETTKGCNDSMCPLEDK